MTDLHRRIPIRIAPQMTTHTELFTLDRVSFRIPSQLLSTGMGLESGSESASVHVNKPLQYIVALD